MCLAPDEPARAPVRDVRNLEVNELCVRSFLGVLCLPVGFEETHFVRDRTQVGSHRVHFLERLACLNILTCLSELLIFVFSNSDLTVDVGILLFHVLYLVAPVLDAHRRLDVGMMPVVVEEVRVFDVHLLGAFHAAVGMDIAVRVMLMAYFHLALHLELLVEEVVEFWFACLVLRVGEKEFARLKSK